MGHHSSRSFALDHWTALIESLPHTPTLLSPLDGSLDQEQGGPGLVDAPCPPRPPCTLIPPPSKHLRGRQSIQRSTRREVLGLLAQILGCRSNGIAATGYHLQPGHSDELAVL